VQGDDVPYYTSSVTIVSKFWRLVFMRTNISVRVQFPYDLVSFLYSCVTDCHVPISAFSPKYETCGRLSWLNCQLSSAR